MTARRYALEVTPAAARQLRKLDRSAAVAIRTAVEALRDEPRPHGAKALAGRQGQLRIRAGDYCVIYAVEDDRLVVLVLAVGQPGQCVRALRTRRGRSLTRRATGPRLDATLITSGPSGNPVPLELCVAPACDQFAASFRRHSAAFAFGAVRRGPGDAVKQFGEVGDRIVAAAGTCSGIQRFGAVRLPRNWCGSRSASASRASDVTSD